MSELKEIWKAIDGYSNYEVSNLGNVKSLSYHETGISKNLKGYVDKHGYVVLNLCKNSKCKLVKVHRLVAITFIPNPENKAEVNHINGIKSDNRVENLEWNTRFENQKHAFNNGLNKIYDHQKIAISKAHAKKVIDMKTGEVFNSMRSAAKRIGINKITLQSYLCGRNPNKTNFKYL